MSILSADDVAAITARAEAATAGPWAVYPMHAEPRVVRAGHGVMGMVAVPSAAPDDYGNANAAFIATARTDVPTLAASHEALRAEVERLRTAVWASEEIDRRAGLLAGVEAERDAALARIAHVEALAPVDCDDDVSDPYFAGWYDGTRAQRDATLATVAPAEAAS